MIASRKWLHVFAASFRELMALGLEGQSIDPDWWARAVEIFAPIQASEAARLHAGNFDRFEPAIRDRLKWGASLTASEIAALRQRHTEFPCSHGRAFTGSQLLLLPCAPVARLAAGADHSQTRAACCATRRPSAWPAYPPSPFPARTAACSWPQPATPTSRCCKLAAQIGAHRSAAAKP